MNGFNWATRSRAWKVIITGFAPAANVGLQLGHALSRVERVTKGLATTEVSRLQLGHALSRVESTRIHIEPVCQRLASIGPRALARGKTQTVSNTGLTFLGFNWATRSRAWKVQVEQFDKQWNKRLQLGHALSRVESPRRDRDLDRLSQLQLGHALSRVERFFVVTNAAPPRSRFNWATRSRAWKARKPSTCLPARPPLQLGHALSRVERGAITPDERVEALASIGPRALARGKTWPHSPCTPYKDSFNWATRSRAWKEFAEPLVDRGSLASIGPRALARGKTDTPEERVKKLAASIGPRALARGKK